MNQVFGSVATGQGDAVNLANYGSFEPAAGQFKLNFFGPLGNTEKRKVPFFNVSAGGKLIGDNSAVLFSNSKFNSGMNLGLKIHIPIRIPIHHSGDEEDSILAKICKGNQEMNRLLNESFFNNDSTYLTILQRQVVARIDTMKIRFRADSILIDRKLIILNNPTDPETVDRLKISTELVALLKQQKQLQEDIDDLKRKDAGYRRLIDSAFLRNNRIGKLYTNLLADSTKRRDSLEMTVTVKAYTAVWLSLVGNIERKKYYTFNRKLPFVDQLKEEKYTAGHAGLELNIVAFGGNKNDPIAGRVPKVHIGNLGLVRLRNNNIGDFTTTEMADGSKTVSNDSSHSLGTKYQVYTDSIVEYKAWKLYANYYYCFGKKGGYALHAFPEVEFRNTRENPVSMGLGFIFGIKNKKDNSVLNLELYGKLIDIGKALETDEPNFINRNEIGIRIGLPVNIPTFK